MRRLIANFAHTSDAVEYVHNVPVFGPAEQEFDHYCSRLAPNLEVDYYICV